MKKGVVWLATAAVAASLVVAGCGDDEENGGGGSAAAFVFNMLNPQRLIVGGDLAEAGDLLLDGVRGSLRLAALPAAADAADVVPGVLGERAQVLGALALAVGEAGAALEFPESIIHPVPGGGVP